ncbi:MAG: adenosine deaminase [Myxococcales bacterium]|nr:adenosine deaminase [Myxococcales bacterium]USN50152.1 MAG: adenosine deaminase [Myxococcales bacterium]
MSRISYELIHSLPKTDLHCHLDGSLRIETLIELAKNCDVQLPSNDPELLMKHYKYGGVRKSLEEYLLGFEPLVAVMQYKENIERVFFELCEDAAKENVVHLEVRYCPYLLIQKGLSQEEVIEACISASQCAREQLGISVVQILCGLKHSDGASILSVAKLAAQFKNHGVVGFDMAGPEKGFPISDHAEAIALAKKNNLFVTLHAGESYGPESIAQALRVGADRIGHGTTLVEDDELLRYVVDHRVGIESCPLSNLHTGSVQSLEEHPLKTFIDRGVRVSINTDNRLCSNTTVTKEIMTMIEYAKLDLNTIRRFLENGFKSAFISYEKRKQLLQSFNTAWDNLSA